MGRYLVEYLIMDPRGNDWPVGMDTLIIADSFSDAEERFVRFYPYTLGYRISFVMRQGSIDKGFTSRESVSDLFLTEEL